MELPPLPKVENDQPPVHLLADRAAQGVLRLGAILGLIRKWPGPAFHGVVAEWLATGLSDEADLAVWCREHWVRFAEAGGIKPSVLNPWRADRFDRALRKADDWWRQGLRVYAWGNGGLPSPADSHTRCPRVLFGRGDMAGNRPWVALFNSRKPRELGAANRWLVALCRLLPELAQLSVTLAGSCGTLSYDLVTFFARDRGVPLLLVTTETLAEWPGTAGWAGCSADLLTGSGGMGVLTCAVDPVACSKAVRMVCRDRLLAHLADVHVLLEIRDRGNLLQALQHQQRHRPKRQWILDVLENSASCRGNAVLQQEFPEWSDRIAAPSSACSVTGACSRTASDVSGKKRLIPQPRKEPGEIPWDRYLYHYTRSCPGPWPGQSYRQYLASLLEEDADRGHSVLDTLLRILKEGRVRGSHRLVRGVQSVVSWTSRPPWDLAEIRRWNRALIRWTFEPYGIAVHRRELRKVGAKPAIYGSAEVFEGLSPEERFRFQLQGSNEVSWKLEREWRLPGDLVLHEDMDAFVFVPDLADAEHLEQRGEAMFPTVVLGNPRQNY